MVAREFVVPVGEEQYHGELRDSAYQEAQRVDGRLVGPMNVLDYECAGRWPVQLVQQGVHDQVAFTSLQRFCQPWTHGRREITERSERSGGAEGIAGADQHSHLGGQLRFDRRHQACLADAGFAVKQHDRAGPGRGFASRIH